MLSVAIQKPNATLILILLFRTCVLKLLGALSVFFFSDIVELDKNVLVVYLFLLIMQVHDGPFHYGCLHSSTGKVYLITFYLTFV